MTESSHRTFFRPAKILLLVVLALLVYGIALVAWTPAGWVWSRVAPEVALPPGLQVQQVSGSLWQGVALVEFQRRPVRLAWQLAWPDMIEHRLPVAVTLETGASRVRGDLVLGWPASLVAEASGRLHVPEFEDLIRQSGGALLEGDIIIDRMRVAASDQGLESATGLGRWPGGQVSWPMGDGRQSAHFPPMQATLADTAEGALLSISEQGKADPAADATLELSGMMNIRVYKRMVDLAGQQWSAAARPGDVVFQVQQPLMPVGGY